MGTTLFTWLLPLIVQICQPDAVPLPSLPANKPVLLHPFFVSVTEFSHNQKENSIEISCKMFTDDFENTLKAQYKAAIDLKNPKDARQLETFTYDYLQKHLQLRINSREVKAEFIGYEVENEAVWCYMQVSQVPVLNKLEVTNSLLYELFNAQVNIMHAGAGSTRKSTRLVFPQKNATFQF